jgi:hypothetical protein
MKKLLDAKSFIPSQQILGLGDSFVLHKLFSEYHYRKTLNSFDLIGTLFELN